MTLNNYQIAYNGLTIGAGTNYPVLSIDGLESLPDLRVQDENKGYRDGMFTGRDFANARTITLEILTLAGGGNTATQNYDLLQKAFQPTSTGTQTLQFLLNNVDTQKRIEARVRTNRTTITPEYTFGYIRSQITLFAPDPRYYDETSQTVTIAASDGLGRTYNKTFPRTYLAWNPVGTTTATNNGWKTTNPVITITGPVAQPQVGNVTNSAQFLTINYTLGTGDTAVIDTDAQTVTINGINARNVLNNASTWWTLAPGANSLYFTGGSIVNGTTTCVATYRSAYI